jgi:hypothetical protein
MLFCKSKNPDPVHRIRFPQLPKAHCLDAWRCSKSDIPYLDESVVVLSAVDSFFRTATVDRGEADQAASLETKARHRSSLVRLSLVSAQVHTCNSIISRLFHNDPC